ncbi:hypothetical protein [Nocardia salmonicida]|uniref:hypothetical protein n=1 Tax=Nocardia salmonicida TaxID=53431 RepID=UPI0036270A58
MTALRERAEHLYDWQRAGIYPTRHDGIHSFVSRVVPSASGLLLDLGSSAGLLARRLHTDGYDVRCIEANAGVIAAGAQAGTYSTAVPVWHTVLNRASVANLSAFVRTIQARTVIAYRSLAALDESGATVEAIGDALADAGVQRLVIEERAIRHHIDRLAGRWTVAELDGPHRAHLINSANITE